MIERFAAQYRARRMLSEQSRWRSFWGALSDLAHGTSTALSDESFVLNPLSKRITQALNYQ